MSLTQTRPIDRDRTVRTHELFLVVLDSPDVGERRAALDTVIEMHLDYAHHQASRYRQRGIPLEDLRQVAALALTKAAQRYDVTSGHDFLSYAAPTIRGELRRHFRDHGWMIRPTRRIQELQGQIAGVEGDLALALGRSPRPAEIAEHLGMAVEPVIEALSADGCFAPSSLDYRADEEMSSVGEMLPAERNDYGAAEAKIVLDPVLGTLNARDRLILGLRFEESLTQREIADRIGVTQMQVSRILTRILAQLRQRIGDIPT